MNIRNRTNLSAAERTVIGDSYGGNISELISYNHPEVFGNCGLQSGAFGPNGNEACNLIARGPLKPIKYYSVWGTYSEVTSNMRSFRDTMIAEGYFFK
jgi:enterochelin esterase-like enzyme